MGNVGYEVLLAIVSLAHFICCCVQRIRQLIYLGIGVGCKGNVVVSGTQLPGAFRHGFYRP